MSERDQEKIYLTFILFCILFLTIIARAFFIQVINKKKLLAYSEDQLIRKTVIFPNRGNIYDRNGHSLAINIQTYNIFSIPKIMKNKRKTLRRLARIVPKFTVRKLNKSLKNRKRFTWIERKVKLNEKQVEKIKELKGIFLEKTTKRIYPNHELMAQILGFVGVDNIGLAGVEYQFDEQLKGDAKIIKYLKDAKGRPIKFESYDTESKASDITLTLDKDIQAMAEKYLKQAVRDHKATRGGVGIIDVSNSEILAMANYPSFDPNRLSKRDKSYRRPSFITDPFEPGSVFKIFPIISALENKIITPETNYFCEEGRFKIGNHTITESDPSRKYQWLSVSDIIKHSSNIGMVKIAFDLTFPLLDETIRKFGFGNKTNIQIPGESRGIYNDKGKTSLLSLSNLSFGQGVATTGIQMLAAYGSIANGGIYHPPTIIKNSEKEGGKRIISADIALKLQEMLISVVENGTAISAKIPYLKIAGKTGTAQRPDKDGRYTGYISNFIGFPIDVEKKFVVYAYIDNPQGKFYSGGRVAAPMVKKIIEYMLFKNKEYQNLSIHAKDIAQSNMDFLETIPSVTRRIGRGGMPRFIGLDKKSSIGLAQKLGIQIEHRGVGIVVKQSVRAGAAFLKNAIVTLRYEPPRYE